MILGPLGALVADPVLALVAVDRLMGGSPGPPLGQVPRRLAAKRPLGSVSW